MHPPTSLLLKNKLEKDRFLYLRKENKMKSKLRRKQLLSTLLSASLLLVQVPPISANQPPLSSSAVVLTGESSVTVTTTKQFTEALKQGASTIIVSGLITIGTEAEANGRMLPVVIPAGTTIEGTPGSTLNCRCPIQLGGDNVTFKNIELIFESSDALGSVPHREIFLAGHSLVLDNVSTYLEGAAGAFGPLGGSESELLPTVFAGGYQNTSIGSNAVLTIKNANKKTMFQDIYMGHTEGRHQDVPYTESASLILDNLVTIRGGIYTDYNSSAEISLIGNGKSYFNHANATNFIGNNETTLTVTRCSISRAFIDGVGTLILKDNAYLMPKTSRLHNIVLQENSCIDFSEVVNVTVTGDFTGENDTNAAGILVLDKEGTLTIQGEVTGTTVFQTENKNFPGTPVIGKSYIIANGEEENFILPQKYIDEEYVMQYHTGEWSVFKSYESEQVLEIGKVEILYAPSAVDISKIIIDQDDMDGSILDEFDREPIPDESVFCKILWRDTENNVINFYDIRESYCFDICNVLCIKTEYLKDDANKDETDWGNISIGFTCSGKHPDNFYFIARTNETVKPKTGDYTLRFYSKDVDFMLNATIEEIKKLDGIMAEIPIYFYDSSKIDAGVSFIDEQASIQPVSEQVYTGKPICPEIEVINRSSGDPLIKDSDYRVSYENNIDVGEAVVKVIGIGNYSGEITQNFSIVKSESEVLLTATMNSDTNTDPILAVYGDKIRFVCQAVPASAKKARAKTAQENTVDFYCGEILLGTAPVDSKGQAVFVYDTAEQKIPIGKSIVYADFGGTAALNPNQNNVSIELTKQVLDAKNIKCITLKDFTYDGTKKTTEIISFTWGNTQEEASLNQEDKIFFVSGEAELSSVLSGTYDEAEILSWSLNEKDAVWYQLPEISEIAKSFSVDPAVTIIPAKAPEQVMIYSSSAPNKEQTVSIQDVIPKELLSEQTAYQLGEVEFDNDSLNTPVLTDGVLTYQAGQAGQGKISVTVTLENYQPMTVLVNVFVTEKTDITIGLDASDITYDGTPYSAWKTALEENENITVTYYDLIEKQYLKEAPTDAGSYSITVHMENDTEIGEETAYFRINPKEIHICPIDRTIQIGEEIPDLKNPQLGIDYEFESGYAPVEGENLGTVKMIYNETPNSEEEGSYEILIGLLEKEYKNYIVTETKGTLYIKAEEIKPEETETSSDEDTSTPETSSDEDTSTPETSSDEDTSTPETSSDEDTSTPETSSDEDTSTPEMSSDEDTSTPETSSDEDTSTPETSSDEDTSIPETSSDEDTSTPETSSDEDTSTPETSSDEDTSIPETSSDEDTSTPETSSDENTSTPETSSEEESKPEETEPEETTPEENFDDDDDDDSEDDDDNEEDFNNRPASSNKNPVIENSTTSISKNENKVDYKDSVKGYISFTQGIVTGSGDGYAKWKQSNNKWWLEYADGTWAHGQKTSDGQQIYKWEKVNGAWYPFDSDGYVENGWHMDFGYQGWFYIDINNGMKTGWQLIGGKWYYLNPISDGTKGKMFADCYTPDGWYVDKNGIWNENIQRKK